MYIFKHKACHIVMFWVHFFDWFLPEGQGCVETNTNNELKIKKVQLLLVILIGSDCEIFTGYAVLSLHRAITVVAWGNKWVWTVANSNCSAQNYQNQPKLHELNILQCHVASSMRSSTVNLRGYTFLKVRNFFLKCVTPLSDFLHWWTCMTLPNVIMKVQPWGMYCNRVYAWIRLV